VERTTAGVAHWLAHLTKEACAAKINVTGFCIRRKDFIIFSLLTLKD